MSREQKVLTEFIEKTIPIIWLILVILQMCGWIDWRASGY